METSNNMENNFDSFKVPQNLDSNDSLSAETNDSDKADTSNVKIENKPDSKKVSRNVTKNRVDVPLPYKEPSWSGIPPISYSFEIIKNGTFVETFNIRNSLVVFGRLDVCDIMFEHPSVSRYHAVVQYCEGDSSHPKGFYLYDLGSTHGTFLNKQKINAKVYYKLKVGYIVKFGGSSRLHIFQGPEEEEKEEKPNSTKEEQEVCTWGMAEDANEEEDLTENPFALSTPNEELYLDDPKKTLRNWFEREGYELEYNVEEKGFKTFSCRIELPIDTASGDFMPVEASVSGKKKEAVVACALEACRTLDRLGLLRQSQQESRQRKKKKWEENDYYDSDEDTYLDRTGTIEKKREMRRRSDKKAEAETYESIEGKLNSIVNEINEIQVKLSVDKSKKLESSSDVDSLEAYMSNLTDSKDMASDKIERRKLRFRLQEAEKEKSHLERLLDIARPAKLPPINKYPGMIGKKLKSKLKIPQPKTEETTSCITVKLNENEEEIEDSDPENAAITNSPKDTKTSSETSKTNSDSKDTKNSKQYGLILNVENKDRGTVVESKKDTVCETEKEMEVDDEDFISSKKTFVGCKKQPHEFESSKEEASLPKKKKKTKPVESNFDMYTSGSEDYATWVPPTGQTGDGMTHLNAKYGY